MSEIENNEIKESITLNGLGIFNAEKTSEPKESQPNSDPINDNPTGSETSNGEINNSLQKEETKDNGSLPEVQDGLKNKEGEPSSTENSEFDYSLASFKEKVEDFDTPDALFEAYNAKLAEIEELKNREPENPFANDKIKELNDLAVRGVDINDSFLKAIGKNWSEMPTDNPKNALEMIEAKMRLDNPKWSDERIEFEMSGKFGFDEESLRSDLSDAYDDEEIINKKVQEKKDRYIKKLGFEAEDARETLVENQVKLKSQGKSPEEVQKEQKAMIEGFNSEVNKLTENYTKHTVKFGDESIELEIDKNLSKEVRVDVKQAFNPETAVAFWEKNFGGYAQGLTKLMTAYNLQSKLAEKLSTEYLEKGKFEAVGKMKNQKTVEAKKAGEVMQGSSWQRAIADAAMASN